MVAEPAQVVQALALPDDSEAITSLLKAASDTLRLDVLRVLHHNAYGVLELCHILNVKQSALSHHLKILAQAELVSTRREGNSIFYRREVLRRDDSLPALQRALFQCIDERPLSPDTQQRIRQVQDDRAASSANFFRQHADSFEQQQERIATYALYSRAVLDLLDKAPLAHRACALEIGPGNGEFLAELSTRFAQVVALDNSGPMLRRAQQHCTDRQIANIDFVLSDTYTAARLGGKMKIQADCIVLNMVLHHTPSPAEIFADVARMLKPQGVLLVTELCRHQQDWTKQACGDLWLGFEPDELIRWADSAGFSAHHSVYHALRNGFQMQLHSFIPSSFVSASSTTPNH